MIRIGIVEDEKKYYEILKQYLEKYEEETGEELDIFPAAWQQQKLQW